MGLKTAGKPVRFAPEGGRRLIMKFARRMQRMRNWFLEIDVIGALLVMLFGPRLEPKPVRVRARRR